MTMPSWSRNERACRGTWRSVAIALAIVCVSTGLAGWSPALRTPALAADSGRFLRTFAPVDESGSGPRDASQAVADAQRFDVIVAPPDTYRGQAEAMRAANPRLLLLAYMNGTFAQAGQGSSYPENWYSHDAAGARVTSRGFGNYMMQPDNRDWIADRASFCTSLVTGSGYGGCMLDMLGIAPTSAAYVSSPAINPVTGLAWTAQDWQRSTSALAAAVDAGSPGVVWGNGYGSGARYFADQKVYSLALRPGVQGALTETWIRNAAQSATDPSSMATWQAGLDELVDLGKTGGQTAVMVKMWGAGTPAEKDVVHRFSLATFMLGSDGRSSFYASYTPGDALVGHPYWGTDIGTPLRAYTVRDGVYRRAFTGGKVLVNPTAAPIKVWLGGNYQDLAGARMRSVTLAPFSGNVFRLV